jgi:hypothetical protein
MWCPVASQESFHWARVSGEPPVTLSILSSASDLPAADQHAANRVVMLGASMHGLHAMSHSNFEYESQIDACNEPCK